MKWSHICYAFALLHGFVCAYIALYSATYGAAAVMPVYCTVLIFGWSVVCCVLFLDIASRQPAESLTLKQLLIQYATILVVRHVGGLLYYTYLRSVLNKCKKVQEERLLTILSDNKGTLYGEKHRLGDITSREEFVSQMPLTDYEHYKSYIQKVANGEENVMTKQEVAFFALTSGTTGSHKMYPISAGYTVTSMKMLPVFLFKHCSRVLGMKRAFNLRLSPRMRYSPSGIPMAGATVFAVKPPPTNIVPNFAHQITQEKPSFFVQAVFALTEPELESITAFSSHILYSFFKYIEHNWQSICAAIQCGRIPAQLEVPADTLTEINHLLIPNASRAGELRRIFGQGMDSLATRIWPHLKYVCVPKSGGFAMSAGRLRALYLRNVPSSFYLGHASSEGMLGFNLEDDIERDVYTCISPSCFLEFIPLEQVDADFPSTVFMDQVEVGQAYEIVVTNRDGLYRYRLGDVVEIVGYNQATPKYKFLYRLGQRLDLVGEKMSEMTLCSSLLKCAASWPGQTLVDYTATESICLEEIFGKRLPACYVVFAEITPDGAQQRLSQCQELQMDARLCSEHESYRVYRAKGSIEPVKIVQVLPGTFDELRAQMEAGYPNMQFKMPRVIRVRHLLEFLCDRIVEDMKDDMSVKD